MSQRIPFDLVAYEQCTWQGPYFICGIADGDPELRAANFMIHEDDEVLVFLNRYPTLLGCTLVCPRRHVERVIGDLSEEAYLRLQLWVYRVGQAVQQVAPTERLYVLSSGSQQGNRHVHWHVAPLSPGVPYQDQQLAALAMSRGLIPITADQVVELAGEIRDRLTLPGEQCTWYLTGQQQVIRRSRLPAATWPARCAV